MKQLIIATTAALLLGAPLALAANPTNNNGPSNTQTTVKQHVAAATLSEQCTTLGTQFDKAEAKHKTDKNFKQALALRSEGKTLCTSHKEADGIKKIESALTMIHVKPMVKS